MIGQVKYKQKCYDLKIQNVFYLKKAIVRWQEKSGWCFEPCQRNETVRATAACIIDKDVMSLTCGRFSSTAAVIVINKLK